MNIIETMEVSEESNNAKVVTIFYHRFSDTEYDGTERKKLNKCEMAVLKNIKRISLSMSSFTLVYDIGYIKFNVPLEWDIQPLVDLAEIKFGKGLNVMQHFAKFRTSKIENQ